ncbi:MAG: hypothetical protein RMJ98_21565, partial [Myxococcales bacterium]|nr:hypothetical protein [Polyangiaceae bacterium]MDW8251893.1 hypothetical protein [Myxococcales bacterium]
KLAEDPKVPRGWSWTLLHRPQDHFLVRNVAWTSDGRCLAATSEGLAFWDGSSWLEMVPEGYPEPKGIRLVRKLAPGQWMIGGDGATLAVLREAGKWELRQGEDRSVSFVMASGDPDDLGVAVGEDSEGRLSLHALAAGRWWRPLSLPEVASILSVARIEDEKWLLAGRRRDGRGYAAVYRPTQWSVEELPSSETRAYLASAGDPARGMGLIVGVGGHTLLVERGQIRAEHAGASVDLAAAAFDGTGRAWAAARGSLWVRSPGGGNPWSCVWSEPSWPSPLVSLVADVGLVVAISVDGAVLEGRLG